MQPKPLIWSGVLLALLVVPAPDAEAQVNGDPETIYRREVFDYQRTGRSDPFRSLLGSVDLGIRFEDLTLRGVVHDENPRQSVAIMTQNGSDRRIRVRVGERIGSMTVMAIHPRRVDLRVEEFGIARSESLHLKAEPAPGTEQ